MKREIRTTADGSKTIYLPDWDENYHSHNGALQEALHVFIKHGLTFKATKETKLTVLEIGFGTGLNALLTQQFAEENNLDVSYHGLEAYPVKKEELDALGYCEMDSLKNLQSKFDLIHAAEWEKSVELSDNFQIKKIEEKLAEFQPEDNSIDLIYFDAFGPRVQPELWTVPIFQKLYDALKIGGVLVTYCAKGQVKRDLKSIGFELENLPGPPGKREMTRVVKV